ncbi:MAG: glycoside hydrolase family 127 protein [Pirellulales bacterium]|nr:glycoside hydrolase family 127 protein [Pirellulales bacterium]
MKIGDKTISIGQESRYPWEGKIKLTLHPGSSARSFTLKLRIPGWARETPVPSSLYTYLRKSNQRPSLSVNGKEEKIVFDLGYATIRRDWKPGDVVELDLPMPIRRVVANEKVAEDRGKVALERGPLVYCIEHADVPGGKVGNLILPDDTPLSARFRADLLGGVEVISGKAEGARYVLKDGKQTIQCSPVSFTAIPYYGWAHRGPGEMAVWLPRNIAAARPLPPPVDPSPQKTDP